MYEWRRMTAEQKASILKLRQSQRRPWHSPPHLDLEADLQYLVTAACYEHAAIIGKSSDRMSQCEDELLKIASELCSVTYSWCVLPNHYHLLVTPDTTNGLPLMMKALNGNYVRYYNRHHQRIGTLWNGRYRGIPIGDERYWLTCLTYIEQNPARAGMT